MYSITQNTLCSIILCHLQNWIDTVGPDVESLFSKPEIKRHEVGVLVVSIATDLVLCFLRLLLIYRVHQYMYMYVYHAPSKSSPLQAIYSLYRTESELVEDLRMVINVSP